jgi:glycosyltransferase involved in cell wall biosynthesis
LTEQTTNLDEVVVVNNNSTDKTNKVIDYFSKIKKLNINTYLEKKVGYPVVRNTGIRVSRNNWVAFIDDDCVAKPNWYENIKKTVLSNNNIDVILGSNRTYYRSNIASLTEYLIYSIWRNGKIINNKIVDFEILDSKNIVYNKKFLNSKNIKFDEEMIMYDNGSSEDSDLGMKIFSNKGRVFFAKNVVVLHKDETSIFNLLKKIIKRSNGHYHYERKWKKIRQGFKQNKIDYLKYLLEYKRTMGINSVRMIYILFLLVIIIPIIFFSKYKYIYEK